ncbi:MAG: FAD-dependent oxidoreductase [Aliishimia sp.]
MRVIIVGAGIMGCALAYRLAKTHAVDVTVLDAAQAPGAGASGASFGWINASFFADEAHFRLRRAGLEAWRTVHGELGLDAITWPGALWWEEQGRGLQAMRAQMSALGCRVSTLNAAQTAQYEPALVDPPAQALRFATEGVAETSSACRALLNGAQIAGAKIVFGVRVNKVEPGRVHTDHGVMHADEVVVAAGTGAEALLADVQMPLPMLKRPGVLLRSAPMPKLIHHVLVTPDGEVRQDASGRLVMPTVAAHQSDETTQITADPREAANAAISRLRKLLRCDHRIDWTEIAMAYRPVPKDGMPVIGAVTPGLYTAVMHSGVTLAAIVAELAAAELVGQASNRTQMLAPYRPGRFN